MRIINLIGIVVPLGLVFGCAASHPTPVVYYPGPSTTLTPTSDRSAVRVYSTTTTPTAVTTGAPGVIEYPPVTDPDLALGESVSQALKGDPYLESVSDNVEAQVSGGVVTLTGTVPYEDDRQRVVNRISLLPGVLRVENKLDTDLRL
jgi:hypothetical protein